MPLECNNVSLNKERFVCSFVAMKFIMGTSPLPQLGCYDIYEACKYVAEYNVHWLGCYDIYEACKYVAGLLDKRDSDIPPIHTVQCID